MKNKFTFRAFAFFFLLTSNLIAQNFWVPDSIFRSYLKTRYGICFTIDDSLITNCSPIRDLKFINIQNLNISDISGIEYFLSLKNLIAPNNSITNISQLPDSLIYLVLNNNQLTTLPNLPMHLRSLRLNHNALTTLPLLHDSIRIVDCGYNQIDSITNFPIFLDEFIAEHNLLKRVPSFPNSLIALALQNNQIDSIISFSNSIQQLGVSNNLLKYLPALPTSLNSFYCSGNKLTTLPTLPNFLVHLNCSDNEIVQLPPLNIGLYQLNCSKNRITHLPALCTNLNELNCSNNQLTHLPSFTNSLQILNCSNNPISCLPLIRSSFYFSLNFNNTFITCVPNLTSNFYFNPHPLTICPINTKTCDYSYTTGYVFIDANANGVMDSLDRGINLPINYYGNYSVTSDTSGFFYAMSDTGNVNFQLNVPLYYSPTTPASQISHVGMDTLYFGIHSNSNINDLNVSIMPVSFMRPGFNAYHSIYYKNTGTTIMNSIIVKALMPNSLTTISTYPLLTATSGDTLIWNVGNLITGQDGYITILDSVSSSAALGTIVNADVWIIPIIGDTTPSNNYNRSTAIIQGSYDPNDKSVIPDNVLPNYSHYFEYVIRFQNTGTDTAFSVLLTDTLSNLLDISTIEMISSSHSTNFWMENGIAKWYFANILLPDSNVNEAESHGFVKFKIKPIANLGAGTQVPNSANIYFDYNAPVITNTIIVNVTPLSVPIIADEKMQLFPNPVHQTVHLNNSKRSALGRVDLINSDGKVIETKIITTNFFDWQVEHLPTGVYIFKGENWNEKILKK